MGEKVKVFAIGDLHLSFSHPVIPGQWENVRQYKPMGVFGSLWQDHYQKIFDNWTKVVSPQDLVLVPGDISWAMTLEEAVYDLDFLGTLPGKIILVRGNHDYWWQSITRVRQALPENVIALQNDSFSVGDIAVCGSRGWTSPGSDGFISQDEIIYLRELQRVELSLKTVSPRAQHIFLMLHFMPGVQSQETSGFIDLMEEYGVELCVYGHLHDPAHDLKLPDMKRGMRFCLVSSDYLGFMPKLIWEEK